MQLINYYKEVFQENLKLVIEFINSAEKQNFDSVKKGYEKSKKKSRLS